MNNIRYKNARYEFEIYCNLMDDMTINLMIMIILIIRR